MKRTNWIKRTDALQLFSHYCAPTALAGLTGISRMEAAATLMAIPGMTHKTVGSVNGYKWDLFLTGLGGKLVRTYHKNTDEELATYDRAMDAWHLGDRQTRPQIKSNGDYTTVARWIKQNPDVTAILMVRGHTLLVRDGKVAADSMRSNSMRAQVTKAMVF